MTDDHILFSVDLAQQIVAKDNVLAEVQEIAARFTKNPPIAVQSVKQSQGTSIGQGLAWESDSCNLCLVTEVAREVNSAPAYGPHRREGLRGQNMTTCRLMRWWQQVRYSHWNRYENHCA